MLIIVTGLPGSGKSTFSRALAQRSGAYLISAGDVARELAETNEEVKAALAAGELAPRQIMNDEMLARVMTNRWTSGGLFPVKQDIILDGYPRYFEQLCDLLFVSLKDELRFIHLSIDESDAMARLVGRGRDDDQIPLIQRRMAIFREETAPVLEYALRRFPDSMVVLSGNMPTGYTVSQAMDYYDVWSGRA